MDSNNYANKICKSIELIVNNAVENAKYDRTIQGTIIKCIDPTIGKYKISYQNSTFYAYSNNSEVTYTNGSSVYILVHGNNMNNEKTILGSVEKLGINYAVTPDKNEAFEEIGTNCIINSTTFELCSYKDNYINILYDKENEELNKVELDIQNLNEYIRNSSALNCSMFVKTRLPIEQQFRGNYGLVFEIIFLDNASEKQVTKNYVLDINQMLGNPYKINNYTKQYGIFDIDGANFQYVKRIYLFVYDFPKVSEDKPNDIFIKDIELGGMKPLTQDELSSYCVTLITPNGTFFDGSDNDTVEKKIQAQVRVKGKIIDNNSQQLNFY